MSDALFGLHGEEASSSGDAHHQQASPERTRRAAHDLPSAGYPVYHLLWTISAGYCDRCEMSHPHRVVLRHCGTGTHCVAVVTSASLRDCDYDDVVMHFGSDFCSGEGSDSCSDYCSCCSCRTSMIWKSWNSCCDGPVHEQVPHRDAGAYHHQHR